MIYFYSLIFTQCVGELYLWYMNLFNYMQLSKCITRTNWYICVLVFILCIECFGCPASIIFSWTTAGHTKRGRNPLFGLPVIHRNCTVLIHLLIIYYLLFIHFFKFYMLLFNKKMELQIYKENKKNITKHFIKQN